MKFACNFCWAPLEKTGQPVKCPQCGAKYNPIKKL